MIWQQGWVWMVAGLVLAIAETLLPGFILLGFAVGAICTGVLVWLGVLGGLPVTLLVFAVASGLGWWGLRRVFGRRGGKPKIWTRDINEN
jgi:membrane protein implicated in regulation of membrane protease activity